MSLVKALSFLVASALAHSALVFLVRGAHEADPKNAQASWQREPATVAEIGEELIDVGALGAPAPLQAPAANDPLPEPPPEREETSLAPPGRAEPAPPAPRPERTPAAPRLVPAGEDWLRVEDQLEPRTATTTERASEPARDLLVERLLEAERRKRERRQRSESAPGAEPSPDPVPASAKARRDDIVSDVPQDLADRFTRAVTEAEKHNPAWSTLPLGQVGSVRVRLSLEDGQLGAPEFEGAPAALLRRLVEKTVFLLRRGNFALPFSARRAGEHWFAIEVRLSQVDDVNRYAYERPTRTRPGRAYFVLPGGRLFEAFVDPNVGPP